MLRLRRRGFPRRGFLCLGGSKNSKNSASGSPRHRGVVQKQKMDQFWPFSPEIFQTKQNQLEINDQTDLNQPKYTCIEELGFS